MLVPHPACVLRMGRIWHVARRPRSSVKEIAANPRFLQTAKIGVGMLSRPEIVRPIRDSSNSGIKRLQRTPKRSGINVLRLVSRGYAVEHRRAVTDTGHLGRESANGSLPNVAVRIDESRNDKPPFAVD